MQQGSRIPRRWSSREDGRPYLPQHFTAGEFRPLCKRAGVRSIHFHSLRHLCGTLLTEAGEHPKMIQEHLGHSDIKITMGMHSHPRDEKRAGGPGADRGPVLQNSLKGRASA